MRIFNTIYLLLLLTPCIAQENVKMIWGPEAVREPKTYISGFFRGNNGGFYSISNRYSGFMGRNSTLVLGSYDKSFNRAFSKELILKNTKGDDLVFEGIFNMNKRLLLFSSFYNKELDKNYAFGQPISDKGDIDPAKFKEIDQISADKKRNTGGFLFKTSKDKSKVLAYHNEPYKKDENQKLIFKVMNENLDVLWTKSVSLPYTDENFVMDNALVDNDGNVFILGFLDLEQKDSRKINYKALILGYYDKGERSKEYSINIGDKFITDITLSTDTVNNLICSGFYSNKFLGGISGAFFTRINPASGDIIAKGYKDFSNDFLSNFMSQRRVEKGRGLTNYDLKNFISRKDGGAILVAEEHYVRVAETRSTTNGVTTTTTTYYYHDEDIIVVSINPDGSIAWTTWVPKKQVTTNDGGPYSSYMMAVVGDKTHIIFNDNPKNIEITDPKKYKYMKNPKKAMVMLNTIDNKGKLSKTPLFKASDKLTILKPKLSLKLSDNELLVYAEKRKLYKLGRMVFN